MEKFKVCTKCHKELTVDNFYKNKINKDGIGTRCKSCLIEYTQQNKNKYQYRIKNKATKLIYDKKYKQRKESKEKAKQVSKLYYEKHKKAILKQRKAYNFIHKKIIYKNPVECHKKELEIWRIKNQKRQATKKGLSHTLTITQWLNIKLFFNNKCAYCGKELPLEQEHFKPLTNGGEYTINNIICSCKSCNCSKGTKEFNMWYPKYKYFSKTREKLILKFLGYNNDHQQLKII